MPAGTFTLYHRNKSKLAMNDLTGITVKLALVTSAYTPSNNSTTGHYLWADVSGNEIANGNGYTTGGATLANDVVTAITNGFKYSSDNVVWTASGGNIPAWRYLVMYISGTQWGMVNPLLGYALGDNTPADIAATTSGNTLTIQPNANGWFDVT